MIEKLIFQMKSSSLNNIFWNITQSKGNKVEKKNRTHHSPVHPKVLCLIIKFADIQWMG